MDLIGSAQVPCSEIGVIFHDIKVVLSNSFFHSVIFVPRVANKVAHSLAKLGLCSVGESVWLKDCPLSVENLVLGDYPNYL